MQLTALQECQHALTDVILDACDALTPEEYAVFLSWLCAVAASEVAIYIGVEERPL